MRNPCLPLVSGVVIFGAACGGASESREVSAPEPVAEEPELADEIEELAAPLVEDEWLAGVAIGWVAEGERGFVGLGQTALEGGHAPAADTLFEIGSISKAFTGIALAAMVDRGEVALDTPVGELFEDVDVPDHAEGPITLEHLATHHAGLPRLPDNMQPSDADDPYAGYGREELAAFFEGFEPRLAPGSHYDYSNLGAGLLGEALAARAESSFEALLEELVIGPLGLEDTAIRLGEDQAGRLAAGHAEGEEVPPWTFDALAGAGALRSTTSDMLTFIEAHFGDERPLAGALAEARTARARIPGGDWIGLGWHIGLEARGGPAGVVWHNGGTGGFHSFLAFDPEREIGVVVLTNSMQPMIEALGTAVMRLLRDEPAGFEVPRLAEVDREVLRRYEGIYELGSNVTMSVVREGDRLLAQVTGQPQIPIYPSSETEFFYRVVDARVAFELDDDGEVEGLTLDQGGETYDAPRISDEAPRRLEVVEVEIDTGILDRYVGAYQLAPEVTLRVEREDDGLVAKVTGQPALAIVPVSETEFVYRDVDAELHFVVDENGEVEKAVVHQSGRQIQAPRIAE